MKEFAYVCVHFKLVYVHVHVGDGNYRIKLYNLANLVYIKEACEGVQDILFIGCFRKTLQR